MKLLKKVATENKKIVYYLVALIAVGVFALVVRPGESPTGDVREPDATPLAPAAAQPSAEPEISLEARLEEFFSMVEGAGQVRVMLGPNTGHETVYAIDVTQSGSSTTEKDAQGGTREVTQHQSQEKTVMITDRQGTDRPLVLREIPAQVQGIVIIAEGGDNAFVRDALTRAAVAVLGVESHRVQVLHGSF